MKPLITFVDDDGRIEVLSKLKPLSAIYNIPFVVAAISGKVGTDPSVFMTEAQLHELEDINWEISSHTVTHLPLGDMTEEEQEYEIKHSKEMLEAMGFEVDTICYPYGSVNNNTNKIARKYYRAGRRTDHLGQINMTPLETYDMVVTPLGAYFDSSTQPYPTNSLEFYKYQVDKAVENNGWLIFMTHVADPSHDSIQQLYLEQTIQYITNLGIEIATLKEGLNQRGNIIDIGRYYTQDLTQDHYVVGTDSSFDGNKMQNVVHIESFSDREFKSPKGYEYKKVIFEYVDFTNANEFLFPERMQGDLITINTNPYARTQGTFKQIFSVGSNNNIYNRSSIDDDTWNEWTLINDFILLPYDAVTIDSLVNSFSNFTLTKVIITTGENRPEGLAGILTTDRRVGHDYYVYQTYEPTEQSSIYRRTWINATNTWSRWLRTTPIAATSMQRNVASFVTSKGEEIFDVTLAKPVWCKSPNDYEEDVFIVTAGATTSGTITISLNAINTTIAVVAGDTATDIAAKIRAVVFTGWVIKGTGVTVIFTKSTYGVTIPPIFTDTDATGTAGTFIIATAGSSLVWVDATGAEV